MAARLVLTLCKTMVTSPKDRSTDSHDVPLLDRELFFGNPQVASGKLSPDGKFISCMEQYQGIVNVWLKAVYCTHLTLTTNRKE